MDALLADAILVVHAAFVLFVVLGLPAIWIGAALSRPFAFNPWFRAAHLAAIAFVVAEAWFGLTCPLTTLEMALRRRAGGASYAGGFVEHWLQRLLYFDAPAWAFVVAYSLFGVLVVAAWWVFPPHAAWRRRPP